MTEQFANSASTYLTSGVGVGGVSLQVASTSAFPSSFPFRLLVDSEIMLCTGKGALFFNVLRAQEGTALASHASGATVACILTAGALNALKGDVLGPSHMYFPLVSTPQSAGVVYMTIGALPPMTYAGFGRGTAVFSLKATLDIPATSTAQIRLYDVTNAAILWESSVIAGPQTGYVIDQTVTPASGSTKLELWLSTPTDTGGNATCPAAGILVTYS